MIRISKRLTREEVAALVCRALDEEKIPVVLSGGAVVSIYSANEYESFDLDFVRVGIAHKVDDVMNGLGFRKEGRDWKHSTSPFWVEILPGPVQVGDAVVTEFAERRTRAGVLRLLAPTECVMDRLAGYYHWGDAQCLEQAVAVARRHPIDLARLEGWSRREGARRKLESFLQRIGRQGSGTS